MGAEQTQNAPRESRVSLKGRRGDHPSLPQIEGRRVKRRSVDPGERDQERMHVRGITETSRSRQDREPPISGRLEPWDVQEWNSEKDVPGKSREKRQSAKSSQPRMVVLESRKTRGRSGVQMEREDPSVWDRGRHHPDAVPVPGERVDLVFDPRRGKRQSRRNT